MKTLAVLAWGLPIDSRVSEAVSGMRESPHLGMMAVYTFDAINRIYGALVGGDAPEVAPLYMQTQTAREGYASGADFEQAREEILKKHGKRV